MEKRLSPKKMVKISALIGIILIGILLMFVTYNTKMFETIRNKINDARKEKIVTVAQYEIMATNGENHEILITIENQNGIEKIISGDLIIEGKGRQKIALDKVLKEGQEYQIKIKPVGEAEELYTLIASNKPNLVITNMDTLGDGSTKTVEIEYPNNEKLVNYYSLDGGENWQEYTQALDILETDNRTIVAKSEYEEGKMVENVTKKRPLIISDSLLSATGKANIKNDKYYRIVIKDEEYTVHTYIEDGDTVFTSNRIYGDANDIGTASTNAKNMVIVKVNGDLLINNGVNITTYGNSYGGPKGMLLYVTGNLENNGTITMTGRGAKAEGQNVYLWKNEDAQYEFVPKVGASGGRSVSCISYYLPTKGATPSDASNRATGGGGSGGAGNGDRDNYERNFRCWFIWNIIFWWNWRRRSSF